MGFWILMLVFFVVMSGMRRGACQVRPIRRIRVGNGMWHRWDDLLETGDRPEGVGSTMPGRYGRDVSVQAWAGPGLRARGSAAAGLGDGRARSRQGGASGPASVRLQRTSGPKSKTKYESPEQRLQRQFVDGTLSIEEYERELDRLIRH